MTTNITKVCPECGKKTTITVDIDAYARWRNGELIQRAFPDMSADDRETLMTGLCIDCQKQIFGF